ncbi:MAG: SDR family NAD(P)-dependent oxidoreductase, partial [Chromatiales bacterium]|nr:SDR family NAD(P)-dependent oxidoreductase [Chromatiales bacterium]
MDLQLTGKTCLVTGASAGIGTAIAHSLAQEGARLVITARRQELLDAVAADIGARTGNTPLTISADLMEEQAPDAIRDFV